MSDPNQPQPFMVTCQKCRHGFRSTGLSVDLAHLHEIKGCLTCGGPRKFRCPKCGNTMKMMRIRGNS